MRKLPLGKLSFGKLPLGKLNIWKVATWENTPGKLSLGKKPLGNITKKITSLQLHARNHECKETGSINLVDSYVKSLLDNPAAYLRHE